MLWRISQLGLWAPLQPQPRERSVYLGFQHTHGIMHKYLQNSSNIFQPQNPFEPSPIKNVPLQFLDASPLFCVITVCKGGHLKTVRFLVKSSIRGNGFTIWLILIIHVDCINREAIASGSTLITYPLNTLKQTVSNGSLRRNHVILISNYFRLTIFKFDNKPFHNVGNRDHDAELR